jgi:hypothetical protein
VIRAGRASDVTLTLTRRAATARHATTTDAAGDAGVPTLAPEPTPAPPDAAVAIAVATPPPPPRDAGPPPPDAARVEAARPVVGSLDAVPTIGAFDVAGSLDRAVARDALARVLPYLRTCYREAAQRAQQTPALTAKITFEITESRGVQAAKVTLADPIGLTTCAQAVVTRIRAREAPDVGTAAVTATITLQPTK